MDPPRGFGTPEFQKRTATIQAAMAQEGLEGLLVMSEAEVRYFSGFHTPFWQSPTRPWFLFIPAEGAPVAVIPEIGAALMRTTWITDIRTWAAPNPADDGVSLLLDLLAPLAQKGAYLGVMKGHETSFRMPLGDWEHLMARLTGLKIKDATKIVQAARMVKSEAEIEKLVHICRIGSATFSRLPEIITPDMPLQEAFRAFRTEALAQGADDVPYVVGGSEQGGYGDVISLPSMRPIAKGDVLMIDSGCVWDGYFCDFDRNWAIGRADATAQRVYDVLWRATQAGIEAAKPGVRACDLFNAMSRVMSELSQEGGDIGRLGHGLGMQLTEQPSLAAFDDTVLQENMVLTLEPSLSYGSGLMMVHEENIVVTPSGGRLLTERASADLPVLFD
ncbi:MAG: Xaa-Pro peptidase family protein [Proteobacteria bacterium]|nr:Xaa-Pro peptidase family protein [Pseudomonadota bacterium]MDA0852822.1 Xaa-Pro peptidase family protein [Pseudomonadota bacterium]